MILILKKLMSCASFLEKKLQKINPKFNMELNLALDYNFFSIVNIWSICFINYRKTESLYYLVFLNKSEKHIIEHARKNKVLI